MKPQRIAMTHQLVLGYGLQEHMDVYVSWECLVGCSAGRSLQQPMQEPMDLVGYRGGAQPSLARRPPPAGA